jgi:hypothetical protein
MMLPAGGTEGTSKPYVIPLYKASEFVASGRGFLKLGDIGLDHAPLMDIDDFYQLLQ